MENITDVTIFDRVLTTGQKVRIARIARRWTQDDLAFEADVTQGDVSKLERDYKVHPAAKTRVLSLLEIQGGV